MARHLEFHFDVVCPFAYLASTQVESLCDRVEATISWHPFLLGGVLQATGVTPWLANTLIPQKARHTVLDAVRWADVLNVPFDWHPDHPVRTLHAMRALLALTDANGVLHDAAPAHALYAAYWVQGRDLYDPVVVVDVLDSVGLDGGALLDQTRDPALKDRLRAVSDAAAARGMFGAPAMFVGDQMFWGNDRLHFVEAALLGQDSHMSA